MDPKPLVAIGTRLPNGAVVIDSYRDLVLCLVTDGHTEYASWGVDAAGGSSHGDYHQTLTEAVAAFAERAALIGRKVPA